MRIAIAFRDQSKQEGRGNERGYTYLGRGEAESLRHFIELETPALANHEYLFGFYSCVAAGASRAPAREFSGDSGF